MDKQILFGTDGIRGATTDPCFAPDSVRRIGAGAGKWLRRTNPERESLHVVIGRDTRESGERILLHLCEGLASEDIRVFDAGVVPTPAVARAVIDLEIPLGIVITASHNPACDNGIKFFKAGGSKLSGREEKDLETTIMESQPPGGMGSPTVMQYDARRHYMDFLVAAFPSLSLIGKSLVCDCANGATARTTPDLLRQLGAQVFPIAIQPDGTNINDGVGSEYPQAAIAELKNTRASLALAHDGDGDRLILIDEKGSIVDGDAILALLGTQWARSQRLQGGSVVSTVMSNEGLADILHANGIELHRSAVGDRNVFSCMLEAGSNLGGESSGHFIASDYLPTGDGLLAALLVLETMQEQDEPLSSLVSHYRPFPQKTKNIRLTAKPPLDSLPELVQEVKSIEAAASAQAGRILLRYSGTEPKIRLLAEARDLSVAENLLQMLEKTVQSHLPVAS